MLVIVMTARHHARWTSGPAKAIQKLHHGSIPRMGGLAIVCGLWFSVLLIGLEKINPLILISAIAASIVFAVGFAEDLTGNVRVPWRLALTFIPAFILADQSQIYLTHLGWAPADALLTSQIIAMVFTAFALTGVTHALNLIDGLNGLAGFTSLWILGGYTILGYLYDDRLIMQICLLLGAPLLGFLIFNWPWGKCFLGDGGAYFLGFSLAWIGVLLAERHHAISPFALLLICSYPVIETLYSMARRMVQGQSTGDPDRSHLHQILVNALINPLLKNHQLLNSNSHNANSLAGILLSLLSLPATALAIYFNAEQSILIGLFIAAILMYWVFYQYLKDQSKGQKRAN